MTVPRRVLHLRASRFVGGPERQILRYVRLSGDAGVSNVIASFVGDGEGEPLLAAARSQGTETMALPSVSLAALSDLVRSLRSTPTALLCTHGYKADILGIIAGRVTGTPVASFLRGWTGEDFKVRAYERLNRRLLCFTSRIVCLSELQRAQMGGSMKTRVVINAIESAGRFSTSQARVELRRRLGIPDQSKVIAAAGRLSPEKGTTFFLAAARRLHTDFPGAHFVVFGDGNLRRTLEEECRGISNIRFTGHVTDFPDLVRGLDALVNPSLAEEMPNVVLEAMSAGIPVVATSVGGVPEIAGTPPAVILVSPRDSVAIASAVAGLLRDKKAASDLGLSGQRRVADAYSPAIQKRQLLDLLAEFTLDSLPPLPAKPFISIVMPVRNEERHIGRVLEQLLQQDYPQDRFEILVADGNSTDKTSEVVEKIASTARVAIRLVSNPKQLSSAGRNAGALASRGDIVAFVDGHCNIPSADLLRSIEDLFRTTGAGCLCRPQPLHVEGNTRFQEALAHTRATLIGHGRDSTIFDMEQERLVDPSSSGAIYRSEVFEKVGMYDESFDACEDVEFNFRVRQAGFPAFSSPRIAVHYSPRKDLASLWKQLVRYGRGRYRFMRKHAEAVTLAQLVPAGFVLWLVALGLAAPFSTWAAWSLAGTIFVYAAVILGFAIRLSFRYGWHHLLISPAVFFCIHGGLGAGFWREALFGRKSGAPAVGVFHRQAPQARTNPQDPGPGATWTSATSNKR